MAKMQGEPSFQQYYEALEQRVLELELQLAQRQTELLSMQEKFTQTSLALIRLNNSLGQEIIENEIAQKKLQEQQYALDQAAMVVISDLNGRLSYVNDAFCKCLGHTREELLQSEQPTLVDLNLQVEATVKTLWPTLAKPSVWQGEIIYHSYASQVVWVAATIVPILDAQNKPDYYLGIYFDISAHKQAEHALQLATGKAEAENSLKSSLLANISHELRTPMHAILSFSNFGIERSEKTARDKLKHYFTRIHQSGERLLTIINDLLELSKLQSHKTNLNFQLTDLYDITQEVVAELQSLWLEKQVHLSIEPPTLVTTVECDKARITQVILNILGNAIKFTPENKHIQVKFGRSSLMTAETGHKQCSTVTLRVKDEGPGIPEDELGKIFGAFEQSTITDNGSGGSGLGLAICKEIVEKHNGRIWAETNKDGGSIFSVVLPIKQIKTMQG